jgi:anti-sigma factor RsiW
MKCEQVSNELIAYLDRRMDSAERREVEEHLAGCASCRKRAEEFRAISSLMDEMPVIEPSLGFDARIRQRVAAEPQRKWFSWLVPQPRLALAAVLLIALTVWIAKLPSNNPATPAPTATTASSDQDFNAIKDLGVLENYDVVTKMDALSELVPAAEQQTQKPDTTQTESND